MMTKGLITPGHNFLGCVPTGRPQESTGTKQRHPESQSDPRNSPVATLCQHTVSFDQILRPTHAPTLCQAFALDAGIGENPVRVELKLDPMEFFHLPQLRESNLVKVMGRRCFLSDSGHGAQE